MKRIALRSFAIGAGALLVAACSTSSDSIAKKGTTTGTNGADGGAGAIAPSGGSVRAAYQVKTSAEIASGISACFGTGVTGISASMIQTADNPAGFLSSRQFTPGADVVTGEATIFDGDPSVERVGVRNSTLSLPILAALQDIGNVVGENCAAQAATNGMCNCATPDAAHQMLTRCLPSIDPAKFAAIESNFAASCQQNPATAIASLIASTAFGVQ